MASLSGKPVAVEDFDGVPVAVDGSSGKPVAVEDSDGVPVAVDGSSGEPVAVEDSVGVPVAVDGSSGEPVTDKDSGSVPVARFTPPSTNAARRKRLSRMKKSSDFFSKCSPEQYAEMVLDLELRVSK